MRLRKYQEAADAFGSLANLREAQLTMDTFENRESVSNAYNNFGIALKNTGRLCEAVDALTKAYHRATNGDDQVATFQCAQILQNTGQCLRMQRKPDEARVFYERALEIGIRIGGANHASNALNHLCIARCRRDTAELKEAIQAYTKACEIWMMKSEEECLKETPDVPDQQRLAALQNQCKKELAELIMFVEQAKERATAAQTPLQSGVATPDSGTC
jgi:tetratricopeptide (TPR) repeat protein